MGHLVPYAGFPYASPPGASRAPHLPRRSTTATLPHRCGRRRTRGDLVNRQRHGRRAGHLVLDTAPLATHTTTDAGAWPPEGDPMDCPLRQGSSASSQGPRCCDHIHTAIIWIIQPETPTRQCAPGSLDNVMAHLRHTVFFTDLCRHAVQARVPRPVKRLSGRPGR